MHRLVSVLAALISTFVFTTVSDAREPLRARRSTAGAVAHANGRVAAGPVRTPIASRPVRAVIANPGGGNGGAFPGPGNIGSAPPVGVPQFTQLNGWNATVPMQHGSCGADCYAHEIVPGLHNTALLGKVSMTCPAGQVVTSLYYEINGMASPTLIATAALQTEMTNVVLHPWSAEEFEQTGQDVFGGSWSGSPDANPNGSAIAFQAMQEPITVVAECDGVEVSQEYHVDTQAKFVDQDF